MVNVLPLLVITRARRWSGIELFQSSWPRFQHSGTRIHLHCLRSKPWKTRGRARFDPSRPTAKRSLRVAVRGLNPRSTLTARPLIPCRALARLDRTGGNLNCKSAHRRVNCNFATPRSAGGIRKRDFPSSYSATPLPLILPPLKTTTPRLSTVNGNPRTTVPSLDDPVPPAQSRRFLPTFAFDPLSGSSRRSNLTGRLTPCNLALKRVSRGPTELGIRMVTV